MHHHQVQLPFYTPIKRITEGLSMRLQKFINAFAGQALKSVCVSQYGCASVECHCDTSITP